MQIRIQNQFVQTAFSLASEIRLMSTQNKKIAILAVAIFGLIAACYVAISYVRSRIKDSPSNPQDQKNPLEKVNILRPLEEATSEPLEQSPKSQKDESPQPDSFLQQPDFQQAEPLSPQMKENQAFPKEPDQKQTVTNWDELEAYARPLLQQPGLEITIPGKGNNFLKSIIQTLLNHRQEIQWDDLDRSQNIQCSNGQIEIDGWSRAALLLDSNIFKNLSEEAIQKRQIPIIDLEIDTFRQLVAWHYIETPVHLKVLQTRKIFEADQIQAVISLHKLATEHREDKLKSACEVYFQRALITPSNQILDVYNAVKKQPKLVALMLDGALKAWKADDKNIPVIKAHLQIILNDLQSNEEDYFEFVSACLEQMKPYENDSFLTRLHDSLFKSLSMQQVEELTRLILKHASQPLDLLQFLAKPFKNNWLDDPQKKLAVILTVCLQTVTPGADLQKLLDASPLGKHFLLGLSNDQLNVLIKQWKTFLNKNELIAKLKHLFATRIDFEPMIEACINQDIDFDKFILEAKGTQFAFSLCAFYVLHISKSGEPETIKKLKIANAMLVLNPLGGGDYYPFGVFLGKNCPTDCLPFMITALPGMCNIPQEIGEGLLDTLLNDMNVDTDRIQTAFEAFWKCRDKYRTYIPSVAMKLLPQIKSEAYLEAIYRAIPPSGAERKDIIEFLKKEHLFNDFGRMRTYKVGLPQDVIDRILS